LRIPATVTAPIGAVAFCSWQYSPHLLDSGPGVFPAQARVLLGGLAINEPFYRVTVEPKNQYVAAYGRAVPLKPGMLLEADILLAEPESEAESNRSTEFWPQALAAEIDVRQLAFRYGDGEPWILQDCSSSVRAGESVAVVGGSGCGKTTLLKVLLGLLPASRGSIRFGGQDLARTGARQVRGMVGAVLQDDQLFAGSIADNISFSIPMPCRRGSKQPLRSRPCTTTSPPCPRVTPA
jgi:ABC-type glutathione transport system ATPase component